MTNLEAIKVNISDAHGVVLTENHFIKALSDVNLSYASLYNISNKLDIDRATIALYDLIIGGAGLSEGSLSYNIDINGVKEARNRLVESLGIYKPDVIKGDNYW